MAEQKWADLKPLFAKAVRGTNGCYEADDILAAILKGELLCWVAWDQPTNTLDAAMATRLVDYPRRTVCSVPFIGGARMRRWIKEFQETVEDYARKAGATGIEGGFRRGWGRMCGMRETGAMLFKDLR